MLSMLLLGESVVDTDTEETMEEDVVKSATVRPMTDAEIEAAGLPPLEQD